IDSVREQVSTMLAEYDFAAGTGEGPQALPPVGDLVSRLLTPSPVMRAPEGTEWRDGVLPLGETTDKQRAEAVRSAADMPRPLVLLGSAKGEAEQKKLADDLTRALRWSAQEAVQPVVHVLPEADFPELKDTIEKSRANFKTVTVQRVSLGLNDKWALFGPDGVEAATAKDAASLFKDVGKLPVTPTGHELTPAVRNWRRQTDPAEIERFMLDHLTELPKQPEQVPAEDMGVHHALLQLRLRDGGPADKAEPRLVPEPSASRFDIAPLQLDLEKAVPPSFALDYLAPKKSLDERKAWNDQLVQMVDLRTPDEINRDGVKGLSIAEMMGLATNTHDQIPGGENANFSRGMATAFYGLAQVLLVPPEHIGLATDKIPGFTDLMRGVINCDLSPAAKQILLHQIDKVKERLEGLDQHGRAGLVEVLNYTIHNCLTN
ncbi:hypothetical protein, partial [Actinoplanes sp. NPDC049265]|uniref:hypothetical protein n=1 Tax=Actinoplanes sp. NPDC049265 TaxID=3363902 RepID=UPI00371322D8